MLKTKALKPSMRERKRYLVYEVQGSVNTKELVAELHRLLGAILGAQAGIMPVKSVGNRGILRMNHTAVDHVKSCFVMMDRIGGKPVNVRSVAVSGILKKATTHLQEK